MHGRGGKVTGEGRVLQKIMGLACGTGVRSTLHVHVGICITQLLSSLLRSFCQSSEDAVMFTTVYLTLFLTHISNVSLMREFLRYITLGQVDGRRVLNTLTINISSSNNKASYSHSRPSVETRLVAECSLHVFTLHLHVHSRAHDDITTVIIIAIAITMMSS